jgi:hypothetical protein
MAVDGDGARSLSSLVKYSGSVPAAAWVIADAVAGPTPGSS